MCQWQCLKMLAQGEIICSGSWRSDCLKGKMLRVREKKIVQNCEGEAWFLKMKPYCSWKQLHHLYSKWVLRFLSQSVIPIGPSIVSEWLPYGMVYIFSGKTNDLRKGKACLHSPAHSGVGWSPLRRADQVQTGGACGQRGASPWAIPEGDGPLLFCLGNTRWGPAQGFYLLSLQSLAWFSGLGPGVFGNVFFHPTGKPIGPSPYSLYSELW